MEKKLSRVPAIFIVKTGNPLGVVPIIDSIKFPNFGIYYSEVILMAIWQGKSRRKPTGGRLKRKRGKRKYELGREPTETKIGERKVKTIKTRGGNRKLRLATESKINIVDPETNKMEVAEILKVVENRANPHFVRRNIITRGALVETSKGIAKVTSRPGQHGILNGVLIKK